MRRNDSIDELTSVRTRTFSKGALAVGGGTLALLASWQLTAWAVAMLGTWTLTAVATTLLPTMLAAHPAPGGAALQPRTNPEITTIADSYSGAMLAGNARALAALFTVDGQYLPPHQPIVKGRAAIQQHFDVLFKGPVKMTGFTLSHFESRVEGDLAYDVGTSRQELRLPDGKTVGDTSKYIAVLKRTQDEWKLAYLTYNSDTPATPCASGQ